ncbi:hypothetical protein Pmani_006703 [Petrolisthes manimaculis]|uniref:Uncharacterized protein n=1 Tax=Petrolisthes manimaculis TaxID=1843537 RepID=A0AAE1QC04_9EUCA|nr:hypothetical protein Pmani_006703 [Petrolisthes manimaculis]
MKESGLLDIWLEGQITNTSQCLKPPSADRSTSDIAALGLQSFFGPLIVLLSAIDPYTRYSPRYLCPLGGTSSLELRHPV